MVDIVMATYNGELFIKEQLDSILNQTYNDIRIIVRDDGSTDNTMSIVRNYELNNPGKVIIVTDDVKTGSSKSNFMRAMKYTTAEYVMCSDQDDYWLPDKIEISLKKMKEIEKRIGNNKPILVFGSYKPVDRYLNEINDDAKGRQEAEYKLTFSNLLVQNYVHGCLMMINRNLVNLMGEYDDRILMHDWWAALIASSCGEIEHIQQVMMLYRQHGNNVVGSVNIKSMGYRFRKMCDPNTKEAPKLYLEQAKLLYDRYEDVFLNNNKEKLMNFIRLYKKNKIGRMMSLINGGFLKSDFARIIGQLWYI